MFWMLKERLIKVSIDVPIQKPSLNYKYKYQTSVTFKVLDILAVPSMRFSCA